ncbi:MAG: radical SAM protein [Lachnospiraceae bacterium]|nr:radical SAM protein [Lachnospiraceae bacterium]
MYKKIEKIANENNTIVCVGCGVVGGVFYDKIRQLNSNVTLTFCDNNQAKWGVYKDAKVTGYEETVRKHPNAIYVITSLQFIHKMKKQLLDLGIREEQIYEQEIQEELKQLYEETKEERKLMASSYFRFEVSLAEHCNLNCKYCSHFSSIAEKEFLDIEQYRKDISRMSELLEAKSGIIYLLGGEPLLYDKVEECMIITRQAFPNSRIILLSNGLLLPKMPSSFFEVCRTHKIVVSVTMYPVNFDYQLIEDLLERENIEFDYMRMSDDECTFSKMPLDIKGSQDAYTSFTNCDMANQCHQLREGKVYTCSVIGCIQHFNKKFNQNLEVTEDDYVDIYQVKNKKQMLEKLAKPAPFCRYCNVQNRKENLRHEISKKEMSEWT